MIEISPQDVPAVVRERVRTGAHAPMALQWLADGSAVYVCAAGERAVQMAVARLTT